MFVVRENTRVYRCPYCSSPLGRKDGGGLMPGHLVICDGCAAPSAFDDAGERLVALDVGELTEDVREGVLGAQRAIRDRYAGSGGLPPGYVWRRAPVCLPCWDELVPGEAIAPVVPLEERRDEVCVICNAVTSLGIYHRMLRPKWEDLGFRLWALASPSEPQSPKPKAQSPEPDLISAIRQWAGQELGVGCASCGKPFYNRDGDPVCGGCRMDAPRKRELLRKRLLETLLQRVVASLPPTVIEVRNTSLLGVEFNAGLYGHKR